MLEDVMSGAMRRMRSRGGSLSFSGLLNAIDGVSSQEGRIIVMTTNFIEKLDPALIRPGRVDLIAEFGLASKLQGEKMFLRFFPDEKDLAKEFMERLPEGRASMAELQGVFLKTKDDPLGALREIPKVIERIEEREKREKEQEEEMKAKAKIEKRKKKEN